MGEEGEGGRKGQGKRERKGRRRLRGEGVWGRGGGDGGGRRRGQTAFVLLAPSDNVSTGSSQGGRSGSVGHASGFGSASHPTSICCMNFEMALLHRE